MRSRADGASPTAAWLVAIGVIGALLMATPAPAATSPAVPSFNESPGCDSLDGIRGPYASRVGLLPMTEPIYGPWGHFYGRTIAHVHQQLVAVHFPDLDKDLFIHQRALPAFQTMLDHLEANAAEGRTYGITPNTWSWSRFTIGSTRRMSFHTVGASIDVNSPTNPYRADNVLITDMPAWFVAAWTDAGWCWGGHWQEIKDPMHYSWKGPLHTAGYAMPPPQPPLVAAASFGSGMDLGVGLAPRAPAGSRHIVADVDRDGAPDVVRVQPLGASGTVGLVAALARYDFTHPVLVAQTETAPTHPSAPVALADMNRDGRPDLVYLRTIGDTLSMQVFTFTQSGIMPSSTVDTAVPLAGGEVILLDDHDLDGHTDLFVISPGDPATLHVWPGPSFSEPTITVPLAVASTGTRFGIGDRVVDGRRDLFALRDDGDMVIHTGASEYQSTIVVPTVGLAGGSESLFVADLDGDGHSDVLLVDQDGSTRMRRGGQSVHDPGLWYRQTAIEGGVHPECPPSPLTPPPGDHDTVALFDPSTGRWCLRGSVGQTVSFYYGNPGDSPMMGDWNCDGVDTPGLHRRSDGFVYLRNSNTQGVADIRFFFGNPGDVALAGDFNGDGCDTVSLYRPSEQRVYVINRLGTDGGGLGAADFSYVFGNTGDAPFVGDFDGDGVDTVGLHRASTGFVYLRNTHAEGPAHHQFFFGNGGDRFVTGDWTGGGVDGPGVFRPSQRAFHLRHTATQGIADESFPMGHSHWLPVAGSFGF